MEFTGNSMKNEPVKPRRHKRRPISEFTSHFEHIFLVLLHGDKNHNRVFGELFRTGFKNKRDVLDSIDHLKKSGLVRINRTPFHKQERLIALTESGIKTAKLIDSVQDYNESLSKLHERAKENFDRPIKGKNVIDEKMRRRILKEKGWTSEEIEQYFEDNFKPYGIKKLLNQSPRFVINILIFKYALLTELNPNETAKSIIQNIVIKLIGDVMKKFQASRYPEINNNHGIFEMITDETLNYCLAVSKLDAFAYTFMNNEVENLMRSFLFILDPSKESVVDLVEGRFMKGELKRQTYQRYKDNWLKIMLPLFYEFINKSN